MEPREIVRFLNYPDRALVEHAVHRANLTEREAEVLDLRYRRELTVEAAAELLDVSPATVKNRSGECMRKLARQELGHADTLHNQAVRIIKAHKATGTETPPSMQIIWDWEHEKIVDKTARIKLMLEMCKQ